MSRLDPDFKYYLFSSRPLDTVYFMPLKFGLGSLMYATEQMAIGMSCYEAAGGPGQTSAEEVKACFIEKLSSDYGFSQQCSVCVTNQLMCLQEHCMEACMSSMMSGVTSPACEACIENNGCKSDFVECSGLNPDIFSP